MVTALECTTLTEAEMQRAIAPLCLTIGLEAFSGVFLAVVFFYVALKVQIGDYVESPGIAAWRCCRHYFGTWAKEFTDNLKTIDMMPLLPLQSRFRFCATCDKTISVASSLFALLGVTRWLNIGNINGCRYLSYAVTCPLMQVELVVLIAPVVPGFRFVWRFVFSLTFIVLMTGYVASIIWLPVFEGSVWTFVQDWDMEQLRPTVKAYVVAGAVCGISIIFLVVLPFLAVMYTINGGHRNHDLPEYYRVILLTVILTWVCFPVWWFLSWEGMAVITDTKLNELGFTLLNIIAKGIFIWLGFSMVQKEKLCPKSEARENPCVPAIISRKGEISVRQSWMVRILQEFDTVAHENVVNWDPDALDPDTEKSEASDFDGSSERVCQSKTANKMLTSQSTHNMGSAREHEELQGMIKTLMKEMKGLKTELAKQSDTRHQPSTSRQGDDGLEDHYRKEHQMNLMSAAPMARPTLEGELLKEPQQAGHFADKIMQLEKRLAQAENAKLLEEGASKLKIKELEMKVKQQERLLQEPQPHRETSSRRSCSEDCHRSSSVPPQGNNHGSHKYQQLMDEPPSRNEGSNRHGAYQSLREEANRNEEYPFNPSGQGSANQSFAQQQQHRNPHCQNGNNYDRNSSMNRGSSPGPSFQGSYNMNNMNSMNSMSSTNMKNGKHPQWNWACWGGDQAHTEAWSESDVVGLSAAGEVQYEMVQL